MRAGVLTFCNILAALCCLKSAFGFDCAEECFGPHSSSTAEQLTCTLLLDALTCYETNQDACDAQYNPIQIEFKLNLIDNQLQERNCIAPVSTAAVSGTPSGPTECPTVTTQDNSPVSEVVHAQSSSGVPSQCTVSGNAPMSHCSIFMHSHLRPIKFRYQSDGIQTCSLPGQWYLLYHESLTVEIAGEADQPPARHTQLTKINVTLPASGNCNSKSYSYVAYRDASLPINFAGISGPHSNVASPLQLHVSEGGSLVTIIATWLNSTVAIRHMGGFLGVTLQVPGKMAFDSEGICVTKCPRYQYIDSVSLVNAFDESCFREKGTALFNCFGVTGGELLSITNTSYADACTFSVLHHHSATMRRMTAAAVQDALLLSAYGDTPVPPVPISEPYIPPTTPPTADTTTIALTTLSESNTVLRPTSMESPVVEHSLSNIEVVSTGVLTAANCYLLLPTVLVTTFQLLCNISS